MKRKCKGCGENLQSIDKEKLGYVPEEKLKGLANDIVCKRCFRLKHYGEIFEKTEANEIYKLEVVQAVKEADIVLPIFDIIDFESSFTNEIIDLLEDKVSIMIINKVDLLPRYIHISEVSKWVRYYLTENNIFPEDIAYISAKNRYGVNGIFRKIQYVAKNILKRKLDSEIKIAVIGVSNVGKSNLINILLNANMNTVSKFSGTTKKNIKNSKKTKEFKLTIIDTPGLIPEGRLLDLLSSDTATKLVPSSEISRKTFRMKEKQVFMFENLAYFSLDKINDNKNQALIGAFASKNVKFHMSNKEKLNAVLKNTEVFKLLDKENYKLYMKNEFETKSFRLERYEDLVISGLGYIEAKDVSVDISVTAPKNVKVLVRKSISKFANFEQEEDFFEFE